MAATAKKMVENKIAVYLDRATGDEANFERVGVNGKMYQVPRGKTVMVPRPVYDVLRRSASARVITERHLTANEYK